MQQEVFENRWKCLIFKSYYGDYGNDFYPIFPLLHNQKIGENRFKIGNMTLQAPSTHFQNLLIMVLKCRFIILEVGQHKTAQIKAPL